MYYTVIKHDSHLRKHQRKVKKQEPQASVFYIPLVFSNAILAYIKVIAQPASQTKLLTCKCNVTTIYHFIYNKSRHFFFFVQLGNYSQQQGKNSSASFLSPSECVAWVTVFGFEAVCIVTLNAITIIVYLKEHSLRKRRMYLVINFAVADMFVASCAVFWCCYLGVHCKFWTTNFLNLESPIVIIDLFHLVQLSSVTSLAVISLERMHATFRPFKHHLTKKKMFGAAIAAAWITAGLVSTSVLLHISQPFTFELAHRHIISYFLSFLFWILLLLLLYSSIAIKIDCGNQTHRHSATIRERKLTKTLFIATVVSLLLALPFTISFI